jgi:molybdopterin biosynthesis enzyme
MLLTLASSGCLVVRAPHAGPVKAGDRVEILRL